MTIREHPLAWRWTKPEHTILPDAVLEQMSPFEEGQASRWCARSLCLLSQDGLSPSEFSTVERRSADVAPGVGRDWLRDQQQDLNASVVISWDQQSAIRTTWEVFTSYWDAFCYPASDDLAVFPDSMSWALCYVHWAEFQFGRRSLAEHPGGAA